MKADKIREMIKQTGNQSVPDCCALVPLPNPSRKCYNMGCGYEGNVSPCPKCDTPTVSMLPAVPRVGSQVPVAYRITWRTDKDGKVHEIRTPIHAANRGLGGVRD